jgi:hypothetical protein
MKNADTFETKNQTATQAAWAFMRFCDECGVSAGYPSLEAEPSVQYLVAGEKRIKTFRANGTIEARPL